MFPILFSVGPLTFHTYGLLIALGVFLGLRITLTLAKKDGYTSRETDEDLHLLYFYSVVGGVLGGRLFHVLIYWQSYVGDFWGIFRIWEGGLVSYHYASC